MEEGEREVFFKALKKMEGKVGSCCLMELRVFQVEDL